MGAWGAGLYSDDLAEDLRSTIAALSRLPFEGDRLLEILRQEAFPDLNVDDDDEGTVFWLVTADQFHKRGIRCESARKAALKIIEDDRDLKSRERLNMSPADLKKRKKVLEELKSALSQPLSKAKSRKTLAKPQPLIVNIGDVFIYPVCRGEQLNPYLASPRDYPHWKQDGWGALVVIECGHLFDCLAWYRALSVTEPFTNQPSLDELLQPRRWVLRPPGTLTKSHMKRMELQKLGAVALSERRLLKHFPERDAPMSFVVNDISLANAMGIWTSLTTSSPLQRILQDVLPSASPKLPPSISALKEVLE